jgi:DNA-binding NarL/FixJ family response regulator
MKAIPPNLDSPIRVMVVDDHTVVRGGLATFLLAYEDLILVGEASNGVEAVAVCGLCNPDVILMDLVMPEMDGATATRIIRENYPNVQVIALTSFKEDDLVQAYWRPVRSAICSRMSQPMNWSMPSAPPTSAGPHWRRKPRVR